MAIAQTADKGHLALAAGFDQGTHGIAGLHRLCRATPAHLHSTLSGISLGDAMRIGFLGTRGVPASYSGFETLAQELGQRLAGRGHEIFVYCRSHHVKTREGYFHGMRLVRLPTIRSKHLETIVHTFLSILHARLRHGIVLVLVCGVGNGILLPLARLLGIRVACNVDGSDHRRKKWGKFASCFLKQSERWVVQFADEIISDCRVVQRHYETAYGRSTPFIPYGADIDHDEGLETLGRFQLTPRRYVLVVARLVPENCVHHVTEAFRKLPDRFGMRLVVVGDAPYASEYIAELRATAGEDTIFTGYLFGRGYRQLLSYAYLMVVASEVGGTHPVLVEGMGAGNCMIVNDTEANLEVIGAAGVAYAGSCGAEGLRPVLASLLSDPERAERYRRLAKQRADQRYQWEAVTDAYSEVFERLAQR